MRDMLKWQSGVGKLSPESEQPSTAKPSIRLPKSGKGGLVEYHETLHRYAPIAKAMDYVRMGWLPLPSLKGTHHGRYAVHMIWLCACKAPQPPTDGQRCGKIGYPLGKGLDRE